MPAVSPSEWRVVCCTVLPAEYMGFLVRNGSDDEMPLLGLQSGTRVPQISDISVDKEGVKIKVRQNLVSASWPGQSVSTLAPTHVVVHTALSVEALNWTAQHLRLCDCLPG